MKKLLLLFCLMNYQFYVISAQTVTGRVVNQNGEGLTGLQLQLYITPNVYNTSSNSDGSFTFSNITRVDKEQLPIGYNISNNYPNPFNPRTRLNISLPKTSEIQIEIYNAVGEKVLGNIEKNLSAGENFVDVEMNGLPNGVYFAKISIDNKYQIIKKLMLLYGSQHLKNNTLRASSIPDQSINKLSVNKTIDSLVITGSGIKNNSFYNLPELSESNLDLGDLTLNTTLTGIPCAGMPTISYEGKTYNTVQIDNQCWLKENLNVGTRINGIAEQTNNGIIEKYCYNDDDTNCDNYGGLYQWNEAMQYITTDGVRGICPEGWHMPTYPELQTLASSSVVGNDGNKLKREDQGSGIGKGTNESGFSALLSGYRRSDGLFYYLGAHGSFWSTAEYGGSDFNGLTLAYSSSSVHFIHLSESQSFNVRCLKDYQHVNIPQAPALLSPSDGATNQSTSPTLSWNASGGVTSYTLQVSENSTFSNYFYNQGGLTNSSQQISGLSNSKTYYWRVNASNSFGTSDWSSVWLFTTRSNSTTKILPPILSSPVNGATNQPVSPAYSWYPSKGAISYTFEIAADSLFNRFFNTMTLVSSSIPSNSLLSLNYATTYYWRVRANGYGGSDWSSVWTFTTIRGCLTNTPCSGIPYIIYENKRYNTVQICNQCWLKENLDVGTMINGTSNQLDNNIIEKYCYDNDTVNCNIYGGLYQWNEIMQYGKTEGLKGICPVGWHVPTSDELRTLVLKVGNDGRALLEKNQGTGGGIGTNTSGFSALLAGMRYFYGDFSNLGNTNSIWSSEQPYALQLWDSGEAFVTFYNSAFGYSVRCLKD